LNILGGFQHIYSRVDTPLKMILCFAFFLLACRVLIVGTPVSSLWSGAPENAELGEKLVVLAPANATSCPNFSVSVFPARGGWRFEQTCFAAEQPPPQYQQSSQQPSQQPSQQLPRQPQPQSEAVPSALTFARVDADTSGAIDVAEAAIAVDALRRALGLKMCPPPEVKEDLSCFSLAGSDDVLTGSEYTAWAQCELASVSAACRQKLMD